MNRTFGQLLESIDKELERVMVFVWDDVFKAIKEDVLERSVEDNVYSVYPNPKQYIRTYQLKTDWAYELQNKGKEIAIFNTRSDRGRWIPEIIETGEGYTDYGHKHRQEYEKPRPFIALARDDLATTSRDLLMRSIKEGLESRGFSLR